MLNYILIKQLLLRVNKIPMLRILTDRGGEYNGNVEHHDFELFLSIKGIEHTTTKVYSSQTNEMCERLIKL